MRVIANGFPKSGCHALQKAIELLGVSPVELMHQPHSTLKPFKWQGKMVVIFRHPRNVLISKCRWDGNALATGNLINLVRDFDGQPMARAYAAYLPWQDDKRVLSIHYEDLVASDGILQVIAAYLQVIYLKDAFTHLLGLTPTWTGKPSHWQNHWSADLDAVWTEIGMPAIEKQLHYEAA